MDLELGGKVALVTGGSKGIGKAVALELAREGADVAICARTQDVLEESARELAQETGRRIVPLVTDVRRAPTWSTPSSRRPSRRSAASTSW